MSMKIGSRGWIMIVSGIAVFIVAFLLGFLLRAFGMTSVKTVVMLQRCVELPSQGISPGGEKCFPAGSREVEVDMVSYLIYGTIEVIVDFSVFCVSLAVLVIAWFIDGLIIGGLQLVGELVPLLSFLEDIPDLPDLNKNQIPDIVESVNGILEQIRDLFMGMIGSMMYNPAEGLEVVFSGFWSV